MILVTIKSPVWFNRTVSIRKDLIELAQKEQQMLEVKIEAKPFDNLIYHIDPSKILSIGKPWFVKGKELVNFPISEMEIDFDGKNLLWFRYLQNGVWRR